MHLKIAEFNHQRPQSHNVASVSQRSAAVTVVADAATNGYVRNRRDSHQLLSLCLRFPSAPCYNRRYGSRNHLRNLYPLQ